LRFSPHPAGGKNSTLEREARNKSRTKKWPGYARNADHEHQHIAGIPRKARAGLFLGDPVPDLPHQSGRQAPHACPFHRCTRWADTLYRGRMYRRHRAQIGTVVGKTLTIQ